MIRHVLVFICVAELAAVRSWVAEDVLTRDHINN